MKAIHVFLWRDGHENCLFVNSLGQRKLAEDTVDFLPLVQLLNECNELPLRCLLRQCVFLAEKAAFLAVFSFAVYIYTAGGVVAHNNHRQARSSGQGFRCFFDFLLALLRQCLSIQNRCHSSVLLSSVFHTFFSVDIKCFRTWVGPHFTEQQDNSNHTAQEGHHLRGSYSG